MKKTPLGCRVKISSIPAWFSRVELGLLSAFLDIEPLGPVLLIENAAVNRKLQRVTFASLFFP